MQNLKLRKISESDTPLLTAWMAADEFHKDISPEIFFEQNTETLVFEDESGPILFVNLSRALRAFVQFAPDQPTRTRVALPEAFAFVKNQASKSGFREMLFESKSRPLIWFCKKFLRFRASPHEYKTAV